ncbi:MAG: bifunctional folylpolyglutamate synthase/dihydrofolate synthase [Desulfovibrionaceae bacterium]|nr:bifunctional folylpolyglutamate synthase/dihydrofolate synthase [Desulfovibrionaceae bacterium]
MCATDFFSSFTDCERYLDGLGLFRMTPGLERMRDVLKRLGLVRPPYAVIQVVGTNGKGSTATMLERLAREHGLRTGLHTSPHFVSVRERVRVNGAMLSGEAWTALGNALMRQGGEALSYFEFVTCLATLAFAQAGADVAVMETGLGGTFDATTALEADLLVFTPFDLDHQAVLGATLREIAADKAGAIRPGKPAVSAPQRPEARAELDRVARERDTFVQEIFPEKGGLKLRLHGEHQQDNARLALAAWRVLLRSAQRGALPAPVSATLVTLCEPKPDVEARALASAWLPGRMQYLPARVAEPDMFSPCALGWPPLLLDGAHNSHGLAALGLSLSRAGIAPLAVVFSCLGDKDLDTMLPHLRALATGLIVAPPIADNPRAMPAAELAARIGLNAFPADSLTQALEIAARHMADRMPEVFDPACARARQHPLLLCGSLYLLGAFYALRPDALENRAD